ncbi:MAG: 2-phosphosulfolactate phosphatase [Candidatus Lokiarchaeota archaeon]
MEKFLEIGEGIPVLIDVLRASSTIITALGNGVKEVIPINSKTNSTNFNKEDYILVGEKNGIKLITRRVDKFWK